MTTTLDPSIPRSLDPLLDRIAALWGITAWRDLQREALEAQLTHRDSLVVLPTGAGKSVCYQGPAAISGGVTIVVSPLIALIKDQVDSLNDRGISADFLNSTQHPREHADVARAVLNGETKLLYVCPERLRDPEFFHLLLKVKFESIVIDEAHCISQWGHDFRPAYAELGNWIARFRAATVRERSFSVHAYTASATPRVRAEIVASLQLRDPVTLVGSFDRPNLNLSVLPRRKLIVQLVTLLYQRPGPGIVYTITRAQAEHTAAALRHHGIRAESYHAGLEPNIRRKAQEEFQRGDFDVVVATIAFGMGIDKADVRYVIHAAMPSSLEVYHQEIGRAGRDGEPAHCVLLYDQEDPGQWADILEVDRQDWLTNPHDCPGELQALEWMVDYCHVSTCRHRYLAAHFGEQLTLDNCGACDVCLGQRVDTPPSLSSASSASSADKPLTGARYG